MFNSGILSYDDDVNLKVPTCGEIERLLNKGWWEPLGAVQDRSL